MEQGEELGVYPEGIGQSWEQGRDRVRTWKDLSHCLVDWWSEETRWEFNAETSERGAVLVPPHFPDDWLPAQTICFPGPAPLCACPPRRARCWGWEGSGAALIFTPCPIRGGSALD